MFASKAPYDPNSPRHQAITRSIAEFVVKDLRPLSVIEGAGFKAMLHTIDPRYQPVVRATLLEKHVVPLYNVTKQEVLSDIRKGSRHAFTTDAWTSMATQGPTGSIGYSNFSKFIKFF
jgi:hypothetical protein